MLIKFFAQESLLALKEFFKNSNFIKFDPHVSENLCQIRAYKFILLNRDKINLKHKICYYKRISDLNNIIFHSEICLKKINEQKRNEVYNDTLMDFVISNNLLYFYNSDEFFIVGSYFLTRFNQKDNNGIYSSIDYDKICSCLLIDSKTFATKISHRIQRILSDLSCDFIESLLNDLPDLTLLKTTLTFLKMKDEVLRSVFPCFSVTEIILKHMLLSKIGLAISVHFKTMLDTSMATVFFKVENNEFYSHRFNQLESIYSDPCVVIECVTDSKIFYKKLKFNHDSHKIDIYKIIMANMAEHPQFSGRKLTEFKENPFNIILNNQNIPVEIKYDAMKLSCDLEYFKTIANQYGCTSVNRNLLLIKHIYCNSPFNITLANYRETLIS